MVAVAEIDAAQLGDLDPPSFLPVLPVESLDPDDAVGDAREVEVPHFSGAIVEEQDGAVSAHEVPLQHEDDAPVAERALRQQAHLG